MPLWEANLPEWAGRNFTRVVPLDVLVFFDGPLTFTFHDVSGGLMLAHLCDEQEEKLRYVVAPTSSKIIDRLKNGSISIRSALDQPLMWLIDTDAEGMVHRAWVAHPDKLPNEALPAADVMLYPSLEPMFRLRAVGNSIQEGEIPTSAIRNIVNGAETAYRSLRDFAAGTVEQSRSVGGLLRAQQFVFASIEIAFQPRVAVNQERIDQLMTRALQWAQNPGDTDRDLPSEDPNEAFVLLQVVRSLSPGKGSSANRVEISGRVADMADGSARRVQLTKRTRRIATSRLRSIERSVLNISEIGVVDRLDLKEFSFLLRQTEETETRHPVEFEFTQDYISSVFSAFQQRSKVAVGGVRQPGERRFYLTSFEIERDVI